MAEQLPEYQLNPQARATDQYARPEVRRSAGGMQLLQVADALKGLSANMAELGDRRVAAWQQAGQMQADQIAASHQDVYKNQQDLKAAVERGEIPNHSNPWLMVRLRQDIARNQAQTAQAAIYNDLRKSDIFHKDDPAAVSQFIGSRFAQLAQGQDSWSIAAMQPVMQQAHAHLMSKWAEERGQERLGEAHTATGAAVLQAVNNHLGDTPASSPEAAPKLPGLISDLQTHYAQLTQVVDKATASKWISDAAFEAGKIHRSADLTRQILDGIKGQDGIKLSDLAENKANLATLPREITELQVMDNQVQESLYQTRVKKDFHTLMSTAQAWAKQNKTTNFWDYKASFEDMKDKLPEAWDEYQKTMAAASAQGLQFQNDQWTRQGEPLNARLWTATLSPAGIDPKEQSDLITQMVKLGTFGRESAKLYDYFVKSHSMGTFIWGDTSPKQMNELVDRMNDQTLSPIEFRKYLLGLADSRKISEADFRWAMLNHHTQQSGEEGVLNYSREVQNLTEQIQGAFTDPNSKNGLRRQDLENDEKYWQALSGAKRELQEGLIALHARPDFKAMSPDQKLAKEKQLLDEVATHHGGWTAKQLVESNRQGNPLEEMGLTGPSASKPLEAPKPVEASKPSEAAPKTADEAIQKADPSAKPLEGYQKNALANYLKDPVLGTVTFGREDYNAHVDRIYKDALLGGEGSDNFAAVSQSGARPDIGAVEKLTWIRATYPDWAKARDYQEGTIAGPNDRFRTSLGNEKTEIEQANLARNRLKDLTPVAQVARRELETILNNPQQPVAGSVAWLNQRDRVFELSNYVEEYSTLRKLVGFRPGEVKAAGADAWKSMPIFVNEQEIKAHGEEVASSLGIKDAKGKADFIAHQLTLTKLMRQQPVGN